MSRRFIRKKENFVCRKCTTQVTGDGYTNHCPTCLWSRHVDIYPGDRAASCGGMMEPIELKVSGEKQTIRHRCRVCGFERSNKTQTCDETETLIALANS